MAKKGYLIYLNIFLIMVMIIILTSSAQQKQKEAQQAPPFHTGGKSFPEPAPAPPPPGLSGANSPMTLLAKPKNFSVSRFSSYVRWGGNHDVYRIPVGGKEVTLAEIKGPGAISHIWTTFRENGRDLVLRFYWEGSEHPSIEAPIGDFFGVAMGINAPINSFPIQVSSEGRARNCWWYMPFNKSAKITVSNVHDPKTLERDYISLYFYIDYQVYSQAIKDITYFHARFQETDPTERGKPVKLLEAEGDGHYVGVIMGQRARTPGWFGEGDDIITVDGKLSFVGTGTEDYFSDAWGFRLFSDLYHGCAVYEGREIGHRLSVYRFHIMDPIPFRKSFKFEIEHWPWVSCWPNTGRGYYSSLGFWYQKEIHKPWPRLERIISSEPWDPAKGRWYVKGAIEGEDLGILGFQSKAGKSARPYMQFLMPNFSGDHMLSFDSGGEGELSVAVPVKEAGTYTVKMHYVRAPDYGTVQLNINGDPIGEPIDTYLRTDDLTRPVWPPKEFVFSGASLEAGLNVFKFMINSKNKESDGYKMGIDCLLLEKEE